MLQLTSVRKSYTTAAFTQTALDDVSIAFRDSEFVAILGPSGSGKTTMLNIIGGLDHYDSGDLIIDNISTKQYTDRDWDTYRNNRIGFVFQSYNLIPHQTVLSNVELALTLSGVSKTERRERAIQALKDVDLGDHIHKKPSQLSGGQMQRVAIARALINDPEILLADEPTGALDSKTSVQIMAMLTEIAKDRLVVMVTHNPNLAEEYATRIVNLSDGKIVNDSDPFIPAEADLNKTGKNARRTVMSFLTAISLSFNNLMTKKGRTIMTAFAGSIGIIGIAAILALANGVDNYIKHVEEDTLSVYPLTIQSTGMDLTTMMTSMMTGGSGTGSETGTASDSSGSGKVTETKMLSNMFSRVGSNDLAALKEFLEGNGGNINQYVNSISYSYSVRPQIFLPDTSTEVRQVNPDKTFSSLSGSSFAGSSAATSSMASLASTSTNVFGKMSSDTSLLNAQYNVVAGHWPENYNECVLVLNDSGGVSDFTLYTMGLRNPAELDAMVKQLANNESVTTSEEKLTFTYDQILGVTFKYVNAADLYQYDATYNVWKDMSTDDEFMKTLVANGETLHISGIIMPNPDAAATSLSSGGIYYTASLVDHLIDESYEREIVQKQLADPATDVITGRLFSDEESGDDKGMDLASLITIDESALSSAFTFDASALQMDTSGLANALGSFDYSSVPAPDLNALFQSLDIPIDPVVLATLVNDLMGGYIQWYFDQGYPLTAADMQAHVYEYLSLPAVQDQIRTAVGDAIDANAVMTQIQAALAVYMQQYVGAIMTSMESQLSAAMAASYSQLSANMANAMGFDQSAFANAFKFNMDENTLTQIMMSYMNAGENSTFDNNLKKLGYVDRTKPSSISIYPKDFESKEGVIRVLDAYNDEMKATGQDDRVITYTDIVGTLMTSVTDIVNMISYVLVAFVAISLVVSSIMIGVITYISVLERKKEIGILRSIGASKRDISNVFNAETLIVGFVAGFLGVAVTALAIIPANIIVYSLFAVPDVAMLPIPAAVILVVISMALTFLAGLIPSSAASRKDPVEALRSE